MDPNTWKNLVFNKDDISIRQGKKGTACWDNLIDIWKKNRVQSTSHILQLSNF